MCILLTILFAVQPRWNERETLNPYIMAFLNFSRKKIMLD